MKRFIYMLAAFALMGAVSCQPDEEVAVHASFTTDKESYDVGDPVVLTNTSMAENALIAICKWELGKGVVSYETTPENISYDQAGEYVIKLTVTSDRGAKKSSFEKTIRVVDNNIRPVADFTWSPEKVVAGEPVQFTDRSTDEDGEVVAWEWKFGTTTSDKQNPEFTFAAQGATEVSLTVTDNKKGRNTKTVTIDVGRGAISLDLLWSYPYDDTKDAYVFGTSPAVSPDGEYVYVTSTGYSLVCFTKAGERLWAFDIGKDGASAENNSGSIKVQSPTPSVDEDGTVYALAGFNEPNKGAGGSAFYAVSGGAGGGSQVWHVNTGVNTSFRFLSPAVTEKYLFIVARNVPSGHQNFQVYDKSSGDLVDERHVNGGSYGGVLPLKNEALYDLEPAYFSDETGETNKQALTAALAQVEGLTVIDAEAPLVTGTLADREQYFYKTDFHWNARGAFAAAQEIARQLAGAGRIAETSVPQAEDFLWSELGGEQRYQGDLNVWFSNQFSMQEDIPRYVPKNAADLRYFLHPGDIESVPRETIVGSGLDKDPVTYNDVFTYNLGYYRAENPAAPEAASVLILKDSFQNATIDYLSAIFRSVTVVDPRSYQETPDLASLLDADGIDLVLFFYHQNNVSRELIDFLSA